jgi:hypothetical protein
MKRSQVQGSTFRVKDKGKIKDAKKRDTDLHRFTQIRELRVKKFHI